MKVLKNYIPAGRYAALWVGLFLYLFCQFFVNSGFPYRVSAWFFLLPAGLWALLRNRMQELQELVRAPLFMPVLVFISYTALQTIYAQMTMGIEWQPLIGCALVLLFVLSIMMLFAKATPVEIERYEFYFIILTLLSGLVCLFLYLVFDYKDQRNNRLIGIGHNAQEILGGQVYAQGGLLALGVLLKRLQAKTLTRPVLWFSLTTIVVVALITVFEQTKGVFLSLALSAIVMLGLFGYRRAALAIAAVSAVLGVFLFFVFVHPQTQAVALFRHLPHGAALLKRGDSHRLDVWTRAVEMIAQKPVLGYGLAAPFPFKYPHPHDLFLSCAYYLGLVGLGLFVFLYGRIFLLFSRQGRDDADIKIFFTLVTLTLFAGLTDLAQPVNGPSVLWIIIWLPFAILGGLLMRRDDKSSHHLFTCSATQPDMPPMAPNNPASPIVST